MKICRYLSVYLLAALTSCTVGEGGRSENSADHEIPLPGLGVRLAVSAVGPLVPALAEGEAHLLYELRVSGFDPRVLRIDSVDVLSGATEDTMLERYRADQLVGMAESFGARPPLVIRPGSESILFFHVTAPAQPRSFGVKHRFWLTHESTAGDTVLVLETAGLDLATEAGPVIDSPLRGGPWYAHAGPANLSHHRRTLAPRAGVLSMDQRFATDWILLAEDGGEARGPDWTATHGQEVYAVEDGIVVVAMDSLPDEAIGAAANSGLLIDWESISGNRVVLDIGEGYYAWYEHLNEGSIEVEVGDSVTRGQALGRVGNSGNTTHPHLHFGITDSPVLGHGRGMPYSFRCFRWAGRLDPMPSWNQVAEADPAEIGLAGPGLNTERWEVRRNEIPLGGTMVSFESVDWAACGG